MLPLRAGRSCDVVAWVPASGDTFVVELLDGNVLLRWQLILVVKRCHHDVESWVETGMVT